MNSMQGKKKKVKSLSYTASLAEEVKRFRISKNQIKRIFKDFKKSFSYLSNDETIRNEAMKADIPTQIPVDIDAQTRFLTDKELSLIIMGQTHYSKSVIVNELFKKKIMPITYDNPDAPWKMIKFHYGIKTITSLCEFDNAFDLGDRTNLLNKQDCISEEVLIDYETDENDAAFENSYVDVMHCSDILYEGMKVVVTPSSKRKAIEEIRSIYEGHFSDLLPILLYAFEYNELSPWDKTELEEIKLLDKDSPILFVKVPSFDKYSRLPLDYKFTKEELSLVLHHSINQHPGAPSCNTTSNSINTSSMNSTSSITSSTFSSSLHCSSSEDMKLFGNLCQLNLISPVTNGFFSLTRSPKLETIDLTDLKVDSDLVTSFENFFDKLTYYCGSCGRRYLVRVLSIITKFAGDSLKNLILQVYDMSYSSLVTPKKVEFAKQQEQMLFSSLISRSTEKQQEICNLIGEILGKLRITLPEHAAAEIDMDPYKDRIITTKVYKGASNTVREFVINKVNSAVAERLLQSMDVLRTTYVGTLQRTVISLEKFEEENVSATEALKNILHFTYGLHIPIKTSSNFMRTLIEKMKQLIYRLPWQADPNLDSNWVMRTSSDMLNSISEVKLTQEVINQITERLRQSHDNFILSIKRLESRVEARQTRHAETQERIKRLYTPKLARLYLEGMSLRDNVLFGVPKLGRELGRGQYGVVYACSAWGPYNQMAVKSVVPPDDKHWCDLAMEFFYCKQMPEHERIASIHGSVIDYNYAYGSNPAILFIMDRMARDFYAAIKQGLDWITRLQVSLDVIEGLRYLHSQGLIHRDIKLKNVLLDYNNRGKLTDLGFCKPCAMLSGSLVGTPIHMAPELFNQEYNFSVDIYAFGILFWYVCNNKVKVPANFDRFSNKESLFEAVKRGLRPERPARIDQECWDLIVRCWHQDPNRRPLPGEIEDVLDAMKYKAQMSINPSTGGGGGPVANINSGASANILMSGAGSGMTYSRQ